MQLLVSSSSLTPLRAQLQDLEELVESPSPAAVSLEILSTQRIRIPEKIYFLTQRQQVEQVPLTLLTMAVSLPTPLLLFYLRHAITNGRLTSVLKILLK